MNSLSWLIYAADVMPPLSRALIVFGIAASLLGVVFSVICKIAEDDPDAIKAGPMARSALVCGLCMIPVGFLMPGKDAIYMIAASQMGEKVVTTPEAKEMLGDLREVIAKQIKKLKDDK